MPGPKIGLAIKSAASKNKKVLLLQRLFKTKLQKAKIFSLQNHINSMALV
jgi:hypothetical protein